jgi:type III protein arginine methyltransferase
VSTRAAGLEALLPMVEGKGLAMAHLARLLLAEGQAERAVDLCLRARAGAPDDPELAALIADVLSTEVPPWHFQIVRDAARNEAYDAALRRTIRPGSRVFEIGAGTGLLAMMAARAGAAEVVTCEANPVVARMARDIVAANGFADRVRVVAKHSTEVDVHTDLGGPADVLVTEIFSNDAVGEGAIPSIEDARRRLLAPDARVIPMRVRIVVALAEDRHLDRRRTGVVAGFDLSRFNAVASPSYQITADAPRLSLRSQPATLFTFDYRRDESFAPELRSVTLIAGEAPINGVAQWIAFDMDPYGGYEVRPEAHAASCWAVMFHSLGGLEGVAPGDAVVVSGRHDRRQLHLWGSAGR